MKSTDWYKCKLTDYIYEKYPEHVDKSEWFVNPAPNQFKGYFPELRKLITFTCAEDGTITEEKRLLVNDPELLHEIVAGCSRGMDAVHEDYVIYLIGREGFDILRDHRMLESCGSIGGRRLYTVSENERRAMTFELLTQLIEENNIPKDVQLLSDSGWECSETEMDGIYYNRKENKMIFTQDGDCYEHWFKLDDWELIYGWNKQCRDCQHRMDDDCTVVKDPRYDGSLSIGLQRIDHCSYFKKKIEVMHSVD